MRLITFLAITAAAAFAAEPFALKDGDRVLLLGDSLLEREQGFGHLETRMHEQFPNVRFSVRNLSWNGDTPRGWSRAAFDAPEKGWERLKEHIALVKPTVAILGYGMAASLQEMTDRSGDISLNRDTTRYGAEPMSAARFKKELGELMDAIEGTAKTPRRQEGETEAAASLRLGDLAVKNAVRFVLLSPIRHEDLRKTRPGLPDPAPHNALLEQYSKAIEELAKERGARFVPAPVWGYEKEPAEKRATYAARTENGIHLDAPSYWLYHRTTLGPALGWVPPAAAPTKEFNVAGGVRPHPLTAAVLKKNDLFFHRTRPANSTYLFGFRKHEQGKNAVEIPQFDPLIEAADAEIDRLKRLPAPAKDAPPEKKPTPAPNGAATPSGGIPEPLREVAESFREVAEPFREVAQPFREVAQPLREVAEPLREVAEPFREVAEPFREVAESFREVAESSVGATFAQVAPSVGQKAAPEPAREAPKPLPLPDFTVQEGYEMTLWADSALVGKPVGMNWDAAGRLWVACSPVYPMIAPGAHPEDKVVVLEDTDHDGKADKTTTFATDMLIAAGVAPDFGTQDAGFKIQDAGAAKDNPASRNLHPASRVSAAYVGASTDLLRLEDTDGDGKADVRRAVLSGFGTEDTHHTIHTLRWGPDGRLYFNQSIYIHSHIETPYGMVRLNSAGILAYDPRTERTEVHAKGWCNPWGHVWDEWGQEFVTDGAGYQGISWLIPGAMYFTYENARRICPSISPGTYPKFCGLELVRSPLFPADWQGTAVTGDFRAHRVARFAINDLSPAKSGYQTKDLPDLVRTTDSSFRPIDIKHGPDGALYIADWTNPVINHGEVDFRDPRRDHTNGRIWRLAPKGKTGKWESLIGEPSNELLQAAKRAANQWEKEQSRRLLNSGPSDLFELNLGVIPMPSATVGPPNFFLKQLVALAEDMLNLPKGRTPAVTDDNAKEVFAALDELAGPNLAGVSRFQSEQRSKWRSGSNEAARSAAFARDLKPLKLYATSKHPRVRLEAMRALSKIPTAESAALVLEAAVNFPGGKDAAAAALPGAPKQQFDNATASETADSHYAYAAWLSVQDLAPHIAEWVEKTSGTAQNAPASRDAMISYALQTLPSAQAAPLLSKIIAKNGVPKDGSGPWIEVIGSSGGPAECRVLLDALLAATIPDGDNNPPLADAKHKFTAKDANRRAAAALVAAARRGVKPANPPYGGWEFHFYAPEECEADAMRLAGLWKVNVATMISGRIQKAETPEMLDAVFESLRTLATEESAQVLTAFLAPQLEKKIDNAFLRHSLEQSTPAVRRRALTALAAFRPDVALAALKGVVAEADEPALLPLWRELFTSEPFKAKFASAIPNDLPKPALAAALRASRELGKKGEKLTTALTPLAGEAPAPAAQDFAALVELTKKNGNPVEGELLYRRAASACTVCHAIGGAGGKVGPDMTTLGASAPLDYIVESTMAPAVKVKEGYHAVALTLKGGRSASGVILRDTDKEVQLRDATGAETVIPKGDITARENIGSLMPAGLLAPLNQREQTHVFAFLAALGKPGPFDATKATVARTWELFPAKEIEAVVSGKAKTPGTRVLTMVDGRLTKTQLTDALQLAPEAADTLVAVARFTGSGKTRLKLTGITKAWLDGAPLAIASEPNPEVELSAGNHTLAVKLDKSALPENLRAECEGVRFLND